MVREVVGSRSKRAKQLRAMGHVPLLEEAGLATFDLPPIGLPHAPVTTRPERTRRQPAAVAPTAQDVARSSEPPSLTYRRREAIAFRWERSATVLGLVFLLAAAIALAQEDNEGCGTPTGCTAPTWGVLGWLTVAMLLAFALAGIGLWVEKRFESRAIELETIEAKRRDELDVIEAIEWEGRRVMGARPRNRDTQAR
jgi:hypothetical protein